jgi:hypothetical protein
MPAKKKSHKPASKKSKKAYDKYQAQHYPAKVRETAAEMKLAARARKKIGGLALGKPKSSRVHKDYKLADAAYQSAGKRLGKLTKHPWKTKRR